MPRERQDFQLLQGLLCSVVKYLTFPGYRDGKPLEVSCLILFKKREKVRKRPKKRDLCVSWDCSLRLGLTARQVNLQLKRIKHALQAAESLRRPPRCLAAASRVTMRHSRRAHCRRHADSREKKKECKGVFLFFF